MAIDNAFIKRFKNETGFRIDNQARIMVPWVFEKHPLPLQAQ